jgi:hypothetical protein
MKRSACREWAENEFGAVGLGDQRRRARTVAIAEAAASLPGGRLTQVFSDPADLEAAFRWVRNPGVSDEALMTASAAATVGRCERHDVVYVALDQSSIHVVDRDGTKGFGHVGPGDRRPARGLQAMSALAVSRAGATLGLVGQIWWSRPDEPSPPFKLDRRPPEARESGLWMRTMNQALTAFEEASSPCRPWFQLDRGADASHVFMFAEERQVLMTVRSAYNRRLANGDGYLWDRVKGSKVLGRRLLTLSPSQARQRGRKKRQVSLSVRSKSVVLSVEDVLTKQRRDISVAAVHVKEHRPPQDAERIEWLLLTTAKVASLRDALHVVDAYTCRWRVEDFHRTWKSGGCNVEDSQLRSPEAFRRWATLLAAVAARVERLKHLARNVPNSPASEVLTRSELDAAIILSRTKKWKRGAELTISEAVQLIAMAGGYTGKSSGGPPGSITLGRGLERVILTAVGIDAARSDQ